jgi:prepilin-type N-terminal cleavage/methylation domain-containing protein
MTRGRGHGGQRGLTLVEVMVAMLLLSFGLLAIAPLFAGAVKTGASSNQLASSNTLAREKLEEAIGYPATDSRLLVPVGKNAAGPAGLTSTGAGSVVGTNTSCNNDLPNWYNPSTGAVSAATLSPGKGWFRYPYQRTYTIEQFGGDLTTRVTSPGTYVAKKVTVTVRATTGPFPGLRQTQQSVFVGYRTNAS